MTIVARFAGRCSKCGAAVPAGTSVEWDQKRIAHLTPAECESAKAAQPPSVRIDLKPIADFLKAAQARGLKFPKLRVLDPNSRELKLTLTMSGAAPGSVSVKRAGDWIGTVRPDGEVRGSLAQDEPLQRQLVRVAADPRAAAKSYAALMNRCCFCGLELKDDGSVECGYGPTCADHWGLPHRAKGIRKLQQPVERPEVVTVGAFGAFGA